MPQESDATIYRRMFVDVWRELHRLRADHQSLMQALIDELPVSDRMRVLQKYDKERAELWEAGVLKLEETLPNLAAEFDKHRPLISPDDGGGKP
jgi:hypothetical protein